MRYLVGLGCLLLTACGDTTRPDDPDAVRTVLFYREDTGETVLLNSDGSDPRALQVGEPGLVPVGLSTSGDEIVLLKGGVLVTSSVRNPGRLDTVLDPVPTRMSLVAFSPDDRYLALFQYQPDPALLVVDRAGRIDTIPVGDAPSLAPVFSPDGADVALISVNTLSVQVTLVALGTPLAPVQRAGFSRFEYRPVFGWPRWSARGILLGTVQPGEIVDTVAVLALNPAQPSDHADVIFRASAPSLTYDASSSYALAPDGEAIVVAAVPAVRGGRQLYLATRASGRLVALLTDPAARPAFPLLLP